MASVGNVILLAGRSNPGLARQVAKELGIQLGKTLLGNFASGENSVQIIEPLGGRKVFVIQSHYPRANEQIIEQALMADAAVRAGAKSVTAVCPFLGYGRQDRLTAAGEPIAARLVTNFLFAAGVSSVIALDPHSQQASPRNKIVGLPAIKIFAGRIKKIAKKDLVIIAPDEGAGKTAKLYANKLGCDLAIIHKQRRGKTVQSRLASGRVNNKVCVVVDDIIDTASTLLAAANVLDKAGAKKLYALATHGLFSAGAIQRLEKSRFEKIIVSDSVISAVSSQKIEILSSAQEIADCIRRLSR